MAADPTEPSDADEHRRRLHALIDLLPRRTRRGILWLLEPEARWARIPVGVLFIIGGFLAILPVFGFWMLPVGLILIGEDIPLVRRVVARMLHCLEKRRPHWFDRSGTD